MKHGYLATNDYTQLERDISPQVSKGLKLGSVPTLTHEKYWMNIVLNIELEIFRITSINRMQVALVYLAYLFLPSLALMSVDECQYISVSIFMLFPSLFHSTKLLERMCLINLEMDMK